MIGQLAVGVVFCLPYVLAYCDMPKEGTFYHNHYAFVLIPYGDLLG